MSNPIAVPGTNVPSGVNVTPGGAQGVQGLTGVQGPPGPSAVSTDAGNIAQLGSDSKILVPQSQIWSVRLRSFNALGNPNFEVDQKTCGSVFTSVAGPASGYYDRWNVGKNAATAILTTQIIDDNKNVPNTNFCITRKALNVKVTTAQASLAAGEYCLISQFVEGSQFRELSNDVSSISLLCYCTAAISFSIAIRDSATANSIVYLCTIPALTVSLVTLPNIPAWPAGGTFGTTPGSLGYQLSICLGSGSTYTAPAAGAWQTGNFIAASGTTNFLGTVNNQFYCYFLQHEPGPVCTQLMDLPFSQNYDQCLRYYCKSMPYGTKPGVANSVFTMRGWCPTGTNPTIRTGAVFPKPMAKSPTAAIYNPNGTANSAYLDGTGNVTINAVNAVNEKEIAQLTASGTINTAGPLLFDYSADTGW